MAGPAAAEGPEEPARRTFGRRRGGVLVTDLLTEVDRQRGDGPVTPGAVARAVTDVLPVDGAGLSTTVGGLRLPLGASTAAAELAEELQTTLGDGPCLTVAETGEPCVVDLAELLRRWPLYGEELLRATPYRSVGALPLPTADPHVVAALDVYAEHPRLSEQLHLDLVVAEVGPVLGGLLDLCLEPVRAATTEEEQPDWYADATARRLDVWFAVGMVVAERRRSRRDALSLLRAHAFGTGRTLDDVAEDVVLGRLAVRSLVE